MMSRLSPQTLWLCATTVMVIMTNMLETRMWREHWDGRGDRDIVVKGLVTQIGNGFEVRSHSTRARYRMQLPLDLAMTRIHEGDQVVVRGTLSSPRPTSNPGSFDQRRWMIRRQQMGSLEVARIRIHHDHSSRLGSGIVGADKVGLVKAPHEVDLDSRSQMLTRIETRIEHLFADPMIQALVLAMTTGDRSRLSPGLVQAFRRTGLSHLLAISGLHFGILLGLVWLLVGSIGARIPGSVMTRRVAVTIVVIGVATAYGFLTGWSASVVRSFLMATIVAIGLVLDRRGWLERSLLLTAIIITLWEPRSWTSLGMQLSFSAVVGIAFCIRFQTHSRTRPGTNNPILSSMTISIAAFVATAPILLANVGWIPLVGILISPAAIALTGLGLSAAIVAMVIPLGGTLLAHVAAGTLELVIESAEWVAHQDIWVVRSSPVRIGLFACLAALAVSIAHRNIRAFHRALLLILASGIVVWILTPAHRLEIVWLDVGQGDAVLVHPPGDHSMMVDTGPGPMAGRTIATALNHRGESTVNILLTHGDQDHIGGLAALHEQVAIQRLWAAWPVKGPAESSVLLAGDRLDLSFSMRGYVLHPSHPGRTNQDALVILLVFGQQGVLLTGDIDAGQELHLMAHYGALLDVVDLVAMHAPHHGSRTSSSGGFIDRAQPKLAVVSAGRSNRFNHPHPEVIQRYISRGIPIMTTSQNGAIRVVLTRDGHAISSHGAGRWKPDHPRP